MEWYTWFFSGVGIVLVGYLYSLYKKNLLHHKFEPIIYVEGQNSEKVSLPLYQCPNINAEVNAAVSAEDRRLPTYNLSNLNPYNNPWLSTPMGSTLFQNQTYYMNQKAQYLNSYRSYQRNIIKQRESDKKMISITLMLKNVGKADGSNIEVELNLRGMFYCDDNREVRVSQKMKEPINNGHNNMGFFMTPLTQENYNYHEWNLQTPMTSPQTILVPHINPQGNHREPLVKMYVNTESCSSLVIHWKVFESTLANPVEGDIEIEVHN